MQIGDNLNGTPAYNLVVYGEGAIAFAAAQAVTVADDGAGTAAAFNLDPQSHQLNGTCSDANGCAGTMQETSAVAGEWFCFVNTGGANVFKFANVANVFAGPTLVVTTGLGLNDSFCAEYRNSMWVTTSAIDN